MGGVCLWTPHSALAQKGARAPLVAPAPPLPSAPNIGILLLAIDDLPALDGVAALPLAPAAEAPAPLAPALPGAITPAAITPARFGLSLTPFWTAAAQKKKSSKEDDLFRLEPEFTRPALPRNATPTPIAPPPAPLQPAQLLGRSHGTAVTLRSALLALGWSDVSLATPGAPLVTDALASRRLTSRALEDLKVAFAAIAAPGVVPTPAMNARASQAAARVGQALGYRAVVALYVAPATATIPPDAAQTAPQTATPPANRSAAFSVFLSDSARENGEAILFDEKGDTDRSLSEAGASTAAALIDKTLRTWPLATPAERSDLAALHLASAKTRLLAGDTAGAQDELNQSIALDSTKSEALVLLGDLLAPTDATGAASAYRRAVEIDSRDGATLAKIAITYANSAIPDWRRALDAGLKAIAAGFDSAPLRVALATAQYGRADLFRQADRLNQADEAELDARTHLDRALELAPEDPSAVRLLGRRLVTARRFSEAAQTLDRIASRYPNDAEIQTQYAAALAGTGGREEDAFVAQSRVWKIAGLRSVDVDAVKYRALARGFDARLFNIGKSAVQLTSGVANAAVPREDALLQLTKLKDDMTDAENAINMVRPPASIGLEVAAARQFAATLMTQALEQEQIYLETGQSLARLRGSQLYTQAVAQLNAARGG